MYNIHFLYKHTYIYLITTTKIVIKMDMSTSLEYKTSPNKHYNFSINNKNQPKLSTIRMQHLNFNKIIFHLVPKEYTRFTKTKQNEKEELLLFTPCFQATLHYSLQALVTTCIKQCVISTSMFNFFLDFTRQDGNRIKKTHQVVPCVRMGTH